MSSRKDNPHGRDDHNKPVTLGDDGTRLIMLTLSLCKSRRRLMKLLPLRAPARIIERELGIMHRIADEIVDLTLDLNADNITVEE